MKEYIKILIASTVVIFVSSVAINLFLTGNIMIFNAALSALLGGIILAFILRRL